MDKILRALKLKEKFSLELDIPIEDYLNSIRQNTSYTAFDLGAYLTDFTDLFESSSRELKGIVDKQGFRIRSKTKTWINGTRRYGGFKGVSSIAEATGTSLSKSAIEIEIKGITPITIFQYAIMMFFLFVMLILTQWYVFLFFFHLVLLGIVYYNIRRSMRILGSQLRDKNNASSVNWDYDDVL